MHPEDTQPGELGYQLRGKGAAFVVVGNEGEETVVDETTHGCPDQSLLLAQQLIDAIKINEGGQSDLIV
jgi:hypothetical protein